MPSIVMYTNVEVPKERAEEQLRQKQSMQEYYMTQASLARAMNRLRAANRKKDV